MKENFDQSRVQTAEKWAEIWDEQADRPKASAAEALKNTSDDHSGVGIGQHEEDDGCRDE